MSASDSDLSEASKTPAPPDIELEQALRRAVVKAQKDGVDGFSLKYIRTAAETKLGLTPGFYKSDADWNQRSKDIINEQMDADPGTQSSPPKPKPKPATSKKLPAKRKSVEKEPAPKKRRKTAQSDDDNVSEESSALSDVASDFEEEAPKKQQKKAPQKPRVTKSKPARAMKEKAAVSDDDEEVEEKETDGAAAAVSADDEAEQPKATEIAAEISDSELSVLIDDEPVPKKKRKSKDSASTKSKTITKSSTKAKPDAEDSDQAEIKRLQGWLVKCGIRKLWGKELKPHETPRAKIKHLKALLSDAGMSGRYSIEKANQIKEARELAADIEAVQEGAERWGAEDEEGGRGEKDDDAGARPARRLVRGAKNYDFLSSDGEETD